MSLITYILLALVILHLFLKWQFQSDLQPLSLPPFFFNINLFILIGG